jgi:hypothetical protein
MRHLRIGVGVNKAGFINAVFVVWFSCKIAQYRVYIRQCSNIREQPFLQVKHLVAVAGNAYIGFTFPRFVSAQRHWSSWRSQSPIKKSSRRARKKPSPSKVLSLLLTRLSSILMELSDSPIGSRSSSRQTVGKYFTVFAKFSSSATTPITGLACGTRAASAKGGTISAEKGCCPLKASSSQSTAKVSCRLGAKVYQVFSPRCGYPLLAAFIF